MTLYNLMLTYQIKTGQSSVYSLLYDIFDMSGLDKRINRETLATLLLTEVGTMSTRWNQTDVFKAFAVAAMLKCSMKYTNLIDLSIKKNNLLWDIDYAETKEMDSNTSETNSRERERRPDLTETRTPDLTDTMTNDLHTSRQDDLTDSVKYGSGTTRTDRSMKDGESITSVSADNMGDGWSNRERVMNTGEDREIYDHKDGSDDTEHRGTQTTDNTGTKTNTQTGTEKVERSGQETTRDNGSRTDEHSENVTIKQTGRKRKLKELWDDALSIEQFNIYDIIINDFMDELMVLVW